MAEVNFVDLPVNECHSTSLIKFNIGSGNGLVSSGNKPLPGPISVAIGPQ